MAENRAELNKNLAQMLKGGVIMDVTTPEQARSPRTPARARSWRWSASPLISVPPAASRV